MTIHVLSNTVVFKLYHEENTGKHDSLFQGSNPNHKRMDLSPMNDVSAIIFHWIYKEKIKQPFFKKDRCFTMCFTEPSKAGVNVWGLSKSRLSYHQTVCFIDTSSNRLCKNSHYVCTQRKSICLLFSAFPPSISFHHRLADISFFTSHLHQRLSCQKHLPPER